MRPFRFGCVLGQTGTGKTFTMEGDPDDENLRGIMPNSFYHIFDNVNAAPANMVSQE